MEQRDHENDVRERLNIVLSFFPRVESSLSVVLGVDLALLGVLAANTPALAKFNSWLLIGLIPLGFISASLVHIYRGFFPRLAGGEQSLVYFREIASRTESNFIEQSLSQNPDQRTRDYLGQVWRNSQILREKYDCLRKAYLLMAWSIVPWLAALMLFIATHRAPDLLIAK